MGALRIHGELLKLGIDVGQTTVAKYIAKRRRPPSQGRKAFLDNHADAIASMDVFVVPTPQLAVMTEQDTIRSLLMMTNLEFIEELFDRVERGSD